jgi:hypothetical protein
VLNDSNFAQTINLSVLPTELSVAVTPSNRILVPHEQMLGHLQIDVPAGLVGSPSNIIDRDVTVVATLGNGSLLGGITVLVRINS